MTDEEDRERLRAEHARDGQPLVMLRPEIMMCPMHLEAFRAEWPAHYPSFMVEAFREVCALDSFAADVGVNDGDPQAWARAVEAALQRKPACCRFDVHKLQELFVICGVAKRKKCDRCRHLRWCVDITATVRETMEPHTATLCLRCADVALAVAT